MADDDRDHKLRVRTERCDSCLYRLHYDKRTRDRILGDAERMDGFVQCHAHDLRAHVCCRGYFDAVGENGCSGVQIAIRLRRAGLDVIEDVAPTDYPQPLDDGDEDDDE